MLSAAEESLVAQIMQTASSERPQQPSSDFTVSEGCGTYPLLDNQLRWHFPSLVVLGVKRLRRIKG